MTKKPTCPVCGAAFSHSGAEMRCTKCGTPDEALTNVRHRRQLRRLKVAVGLKINPGTRHKRRNKHGRIGASR
jgi:tRNA(Ile2) C34 agmatinyltransferase TiaS